MAAAASLNFIRRGWRNVREAGPQRLAITGLLLLLAVLLARFSWGLPFVGNAEAGLYDFRAFAVANELRVEQDDRIALVVYDEQTLIEARKRSPLDRGVLLRALRNLDGMGAKAIGIDILFDQPQDEDEELLETLRAMKTPVSVAYVDMEINEDDLVYDQQLYLDTFQRQLAGSNARAASIQLNNDRSVTRIFPAIDERLPDTLTRSMIEAAGKGDPSLPGYTGSIRYRLGLYSGDGGAEAKKVAEPLFAKIPIGTFANDELLAIPGVADELAAGVAGKYILIGADLVDFDRVPTSLTQWTAEEPPGLQVHAEMMAQMLDGEAMPKPLPITLWALALLVIVSAALTGLLEWKSWRVYPLMLAQFAIFLGVPLLMHFRGIDTYELPAFGWILAWIVAFTAITSAARASTAQQRQFAQGALGKYLPREMAQEIIDNPNLLALHGEKKSIFVLFSDLEGFTKMSHAVSPEMVAKLLNRYLEMLSQVVLDHGGVIDKFVGDAVVAFWGAPIAKPGDAERAARAGYAIWQAGEAFREEVAKMDSALPKIGKTRVGLHYGEAVVGNFGGETRIQYTALGDSMNTAARLEAANKALESSVMASREFAEKSGLNWWRPMGRVVLRGRAKPVDILEPAPDFPEEDRKKLHQAMILSQSNNTEALEVVEQIVRSHPDDTALVNLLHRMKNLNEERAYVLG
ncbi:adenylate/guanylate cyclase domain-containing protein [Pontixanthobacter gangjinensis]|uniref:CHASE2 domain-containing protein n=1 Tax=Pontixanthobacter gangjinensis TaxID=1028742 RepID=A0A6I4SKD2_9SPHN|nr:adenylate/guanylate cyclase domain-containing protein [Pontixanthobacter gangjinensis]MXO56173.1 CHASE2 domain-containing protein [Pontixanthobacter gangjinensis]